MTTIHEIDQKISYLNSVLKDNKVLSDSDIKQITTRYKAGFYALALDFLWRRLRVCVKEFYRDFDTNLINTILFIPQKDLLSPFSCYDIEILYRLGVINLNQKYDLLKVYLEVQDNLVNPTLTERKFQNILELCMKTVFNKDLMSYREKLYNISQKIGSTLLSSDPEFLEYVARPRFISTAIRYLLYAYEFDEDCDKQVVERNLMLLVSSGWIDLKYEDRLELHYFATNCKTETTRQLCRNLLNFSTSENSFVDPKHIDELVVSSKRLVSSYYSFKYREYLPDALYNMTCIKHIPVEYVGLYAGSALLCLVSEKLDHNENTKAFAEKILKKLSHEHIEYYLNNCITGDYDVLLALTSSKDAKLEFIKWLKTLGISHMQIVDPMSSRLITAALSDNLTYFNNVLKEILY